MNRQFEPIPLKVMRPATVGLIAFSGAVLVDLLPALIVVCGYNAVARVVSR